MLRTIIGLVANRVEVAHYRLNDDAATQVLVDSSSSGYNLTRAVEDSADRTVIGKVNSAQEFTASGEYACRMPLPNGTAGAIMAWCNFTAGSTGQTIVSQRIAGIENIDYQIATADAIGNIKFRGTFDSMSKEITTSTPPSGTFHVAVIWANGTCAMYINGSQVGSFTYAAYTPAEATGAMFCVGGRDFSAGLQLNGWLDDVRVYNTEITAGDLARVYNQGNGTELRLEEI